MQDKMEPQEIQEWEEETRRAMASTFPEQVKCLSLRSEPSFTQSKLPEDIEEQEEVAQQLPLPESKPAVSSLSAPAVEVQEEEMKLALKRFYDVKYDGENLIVLDRHLSTIDTFRATIYKGLPEVVEASGTEWVRKIHIDEAICVNPGNTNRLVRSNMFSWFAKSCILEKQGYEMNTDWEFIYVDKKTVEKEDIDVDMGVIYVVTNSKSPYYAGMSDKNTLLLTETIIHLHQEFHGMSLRQIASYINGGFDVRFLNTPYLMDFIISEFIDEMKELCIAENTPITKLYECDFNNTFDYPFERKNDAININVIKHMTDIYLMPISCFFSDKTYGNIPWIISDPFIRDRIRSEASLVANPLIYISNNDGRFPAVYYNYISVFPSLQLNGKTYAPGSSIGTVLYADGSSDTFMRGELFEEISAREQFILVMMYDKFIAKELSHDDKCADMFRYFELNEREYRVRPDFIKLIQEQLLTRV
jgi:hypothetical protein